MQKLAGSTFTNEEQQEIKRVIRKAMRSVLRGKKQNCTRVDFDLTQNMNNKAL